MKRERVVYWLIILLILLAAGVGIPAAVHYGMKPRCYACNHYRHQHRMCGAYVGTDFTTCICEKDK